MQKLIQFQKMLPKGSVLVFSLLVLALMLTAALSIMSASVLERKASLSTGSSTKSFQVADSGVEEVLYQVYQNSGIVNIEDIAAGLGVTCNAGVVTKSLGSGAEYEITFYDNTGAQISNCAESKDSIDKIKSVGTSSGTSRAVEVAVAAGEAVYQLSCARISSIDMTYCCRINISNGETKCYSKPDSTSFWADYHLNTVFTATTSGSYSIECSETVPFKGVQCCRFNQVTGEIGTHECKCPMGPWSDCEFGEITF